MAVSERKELLLRFGSEKLRLKRPAKMFYAGCLPQGPVVRLSYALHVFMVHRPTLRSVIFRAPKQFGRHKESRCSIGDQASTYCLLSEVRYTFHAQSTQLKTTV